MYFHFQHKRIVDVAVGVAHCLALSSSGEIFGWGRNDNQQICPASVCSVTLLQQPILVSLPTLPASGMACTAVQSLIWTQSTRQGVPLRAPFVIDLGETTFRLLDQLLGMCSASAAQDNRQTPNQESECIAVACLNLVRLQLLALIANNVEPRNVGLASGGRLLNSLKTRILSLAGGSQVLRTIQIAAQQALQVGVKKKFISSFLSRKLFTSSVMRQFMIDSFYKLNSSCDKTLNTYICILQRVGHPFSCRLLTNQYTLLTHL